MAGPRALLALAQRHTPRPGVVVERQMRPRVRDHQLHRHRQGQRIVTGHEAPARIGVPQLVHSIAQPRPRCPPAEPEEPRVRRYLGPLHPTRRTTRHRLPPARRQLPPEHHPARRTQLHRSVPRHHQRQPLRDHLPAAVLVRLQHSPRIRLRRRTRQRVRRQRLRPVPRPEHGSAHRDPDVQLRTGESHDTTTGPGLRPHQQTRHSRPLRTTARQRPGIRPLPTPGRAHRAQPLHRTHHLHRTHQVATVHAAHPAT